MEEKKYTLLPADDAVQNWFEENINKECSALSAIYKFRLWLESLQCKAITGAVWVKASEFNFIENTEYFYKYEYLNKAFKGVAKYEDGMLFSSKTTVLPTGYAELFILDEGTAAWREEDAVKKEVIDFIRDIAKNWDCDEDGHKYNTGCRKCSASELLYDLTKQQKEK